MSSWSEHAIWWHLHPISFLGAEGTAAAAGPAPAHRLGRLAAWLDYVVNLGCNGLILGPVFASETHGYDTIDHFTVDPRLGTQADLEGLIAQARDRGVHIVLDGVFNHVSRRFPRPEWLSGTVFEGHDSLPELDHARPEVAAYVTDVMTYWLDRGISGWRLDAAYAVPMEFWREVTGRVRREFPRAWLLGEVIHGDYARYVSEGGLDSVTQYELWKAIWSSLNDRNFFELAWALDRHNHYAGTFAPLTFAGNHDVTRLASKLADDRHLAHALAILFTVAGTPSVYAGDEQAFRGVKYERIDGDAEIRPAFPAGPAGLAPDGWPVYRLHQDLIGLRRRNPWLVRSTVKVLHLDNQVFAFQASDGEQALAVLLNVSDLDATVPVVEGKRVLASDPDRAAGSVEPHGWAILEVEGATTDRSV